jgi:uncharacterized membrane protein
LSHGDGKEIDSPKDSQDAGGWGTARSLRRGDRRFDEVAPTEGDRREIDTTPHNDFEDDGSPESVLAFAEMHLGPLPHPSILSGYNEVVPGSAELIIKLYAENARVRNALLDRAGRAESSAVRIGAWVSALLAVGGLGSAVWLALAGNVLAGVVIGGVPAVVIAVARIASAVRGGQPDEH